MVEVLDYGVPYEQVVIDITMGSSGGVLQDFKGYVDPFFEVF
jgi:hypothetical protein